MKKLVAGFILTGVGSLSCWYFWTRALAAVPKTGDESGSGVAAVVGFAMAVVGVICIVVMIDEHINPSKKNGYGG